MIGKPSLVTTTYQQLANVPDHEWRAIIERKLALQEGEANAESDNTHNSSNSDNKSALIPKSREVYASLGVEITNISVESPSGSSLNQVPFRTAFQLRFQYRSRPDFPKQPLRFGCHIANTQGIRVTGQAHPSKTELLTISPDSTWELIFSFGPGLHPGLYFVGGGISPNDQSGSFLHRVIDYVAFRVLESPESLPVGLCDLSSNPAELLKPPVAQKPAGT